VPLARYQTMRNDSSVQPVLTTGGNVEVPVFPTIFRESWDQDVSFVAEDDPVISPPGELLYVIVHAYVGELALLANIAGRGFCTPSGHIDPGETPLDAALRETYEETGGHVDTARCKLIGYHCFISRSGIAAGSARYAAAFVAEVDHMGAIPAGSESRGIVTIPFDDIADQYFLWDELMASVFAFADAERVRLLGTAPRH